MKNIKRTISTMLLIITMIFVCCSCGNKAAGKFGLFARIWESFKVTFIDNDGWISLLNGLLSTVLLTVVTLILGTALGYAVFYLIYSGSKVAEAVFVWIRRFLVLIPFSTFLFICFYLLFSHSMDKPMIAAGFALTVLWASNVCSKVCTAVEQISPGQTEAAQAMGYSRNQILRYIIMPQALPEIMGVFDEEVIAHINATSLVGMISAVDLQKVIDILTQKTNEPAMPIIVASAMYLLLGFLLSSLITMIGKKCTVRNRSAEKILSDVRKGVLG